MASVVVTGELQLQELMLSLKSEGKAGGKIIRKALRAGAKVIAARVKAMVPRKTGLMARSVKVRALKRKKGRIGVRVAVEAENPKTGAPYPFFLEHGIKRQRSMINYGHVTDARVRKIWRRKRLVDSKAYDALAWHVAPQHNVEKAFDAVQSQAQQVIMQTAVTQLEMARATK